MAKRKSRKYSSFTFYSEATWMRVVLLSIFVGVVGVIGGLILLSGMGVGL